MKVTVNGKAEILENTESLQTFLKNLQVQSQAVAVALNGQVIRRQEYSLKILKEGDALEIVRMVGGG